ncbi:MAG: SprT-like domain-containing protein [Chthoniobacterales bacterium]
MLRFEQLDLTFGLRGLVAPHRFSLPDPKPQKPLISPAPPARGRDASLEQIARELLISAGAPSLAQLLRVEWHPRLRTAAGRAAFHQALVSLNPRLQEHGLAEIDRTLRHELAHLLAHERAGRRRISPHGPEWRQACRDLGIADEQRCHTLPFPATRRARRLLYRCPHCAAEFPRVRRIRRAVACLACCRRHNRGKFSKQFQLQLVRNPDAN